MTELDDVWFLGDRLWDNPRFSALRYIIGLAAGICRRVAQSCMSSGLRPAAERLL